MANDTSGNPYETTDVPEEANPQSVLQGTWSIRERFVCCDGSTELPRICHATLETENLSSFDQTLKCAPPFFDKIWPVLVLLVILSSWLNLGRAIELGAVVVMVGLGLGGSFFTKVVKIRLYESQATRRSRRKVRRGASIIRGLAIVLGLGLFLFLMNSSVSSNVGAVLIFVVIAAGLFAPQMVFDWTTTPKLSMQRNKDGSYRIEGLNDQYVATLNKHQGEAWY